jgi:polar amino acid transport system permease protein
MSFDPGLLWQYAPLMLSGLWTTLVVCAAAIVIAILLGLVLALGLLGRSRVAAAAARAYVETMRGTPVLVLLFLLYYGGPSLGLLLDPVPAGIVGLGLYGAGYFAEIFRAGFASIPEGQVEAARLVGLTERQIVRRIKLPQMLALILPPGVGQVIILVKESALLSTITVAELTKNATQMANETFAVIEPFLLVALLYWGLVELIAQIGQRLERRVGWLN